MAIISHNDIRPDGLRIFYGTAPPGSSSDGTYYTGEVIVAIGSTPGQPTGWRCVAGGTPGNWVALGLSTEPYTLGPYNGSSPNFAIPLSNSYIIQGVSVCYTSVAGSGTVTVERDTGSTWPGSGGVAQLVAPISLMSTATVTYTGTVIGSPAIFSGGLDRIGVVFTPNSAMGGLGSMYITIVMAQVI